MKCVIDASFIAGLLMPDESDEKSAALLDQLRDDGATAPTLWQLEIANILLTAERRKRIDASQLTRLFEAINALPVSLEPALSPKHIGDVVHLAREHRLTAYDASYLELAARLNLPLATLDNDLYRAAKTIGVKLLIS